MSNEQDEVTPETVLRWGLQQRIADLEAERKSWRGALTPTRLKLLADLHQTEAERDRANQIALDDNEALQEVIGERDRALADANRLTEALDSLMGWAKGNSDDWPNAPRGVGPRTDALFAKSKAALAQHREEQGL